jgi:hypothetical protein
MPSVRPLVAAFGVVREVTKPLNDGFEKPVIPPGTTPANMAEAVSLTDCNYLSVKWFNHYL